MVIIYMSSYATDHTVYAESSSFVHRVAKLARVIRISGLAASHQCISELVSEWISIIVIYVENFKVTLQILSRGRLAVVYDLWNSSFQSFRKSLHCVISGCYLLPRVLQNDAVTSDLSNNSGQCVQFICRLQSLWLA